MKDFFGKHKILKEFMPLILAILLTVLVLFSPVTASPQYSMSQLKKFAVNSSSQPAFVGYSIKEQAYQQPNFLPVLGSSELEHFDAFHPSVYSAKYQTSWTPFLAGQPGTQSLSQFFYVNSVAQKLKNRKIVFIISPQWFTPKGVAPTALTNFVSKGEIYTWLRTADAKSSTTQALAKRLLTFKDFNDDFLIKVGMGSLAKGKKLNLLEQLGVSIAEQFWKKEDLLFSWINAGRNSKFNPLKNVNQYEKQLPEVADSRQLEELAFEQGQKAANNNDFAVNNTVWLNSLSKVAPQRKGIMKNVSYTQSPEFADFQQLLNQFALNHDDVQFIIQPVNGAWYSYSGLSLETLEKFRDKISYQLRSQGFNNIVDFTERYDAPYFVEDTIHFGTRGWLAVDQSINQFMKAPLKHDYHLDNQKFLSQSWQMKK